MTMQEEKQGLEREQEEKAIRAQRKADMEHLVKNIHPALVDMASFGDRSDGTTQTVSDYAAVILEEKLEALKEELSSVVAHVNSLAAEIVQRKNDFDILCSKILADWTPETPLEELEPIAPAPAPEKAPTEETEETPKKKGKH